MSTNRKRIDLAQFNTPIRLNQRSSNPVYKATNLVTGRLWFLKYYEPLHKKIPGNHHPYELEGIGADIYAFILGKSRVAQAEVVKDELVDHAALGSELNEAGFYSGHELASGYSDCPKDDYEAERDYIWQKIFTLDRGIAEAQMAMVINDEIDWNHANIGANRAGDISRIDCDDSQISVKCKYFGAKYSMFNYFMLPEMPKLGLMLAFNQELEDKTQDPYVKIRYYRSMVWALLLSDVVMQTICSRHTASEEMIKDVVEEMRRTQEDLRACMLNSPGFLAYLKKSQFADVRAELEDFFAHEKKHSPDLYARAFVDMEALFNRLGTLRTFYLSKGDLKVEFQLGTDLSIKNTNGDTLLQAFVRHKRHEQLRELLDHTNVPPGLMTVDADDRTPLTVAVDAGDLIAVKLLLNRITALNDNKEGYPKVLAILDKALSQANLKEHPEIESLLRKLKFHHENLCYYTGGSLTGQFSIHRFWNHYTHKQAGNLQQEKTAEAGLLALT